jgi:hypothetical protein
MVVLMAWTKKDLTLTKVNSLEELGQIWGPTLDPVEVRVLKGKLEVPPPSLLNPSQLTSL